MQDAEFRLRPVELDRESYLFDDKTASEAATGRLDFRFSYSTGIQKPWPYFGIEAKRLHVFFPSGWDSLVPEYVTGHQGMMCFIEQRYAQGLASGGMLPSSSPVRDVARRSRRGRGRISGLRKTETPW